MACFGIHVKLWVYVLQSSWIFGVCCLLLRVDGNQLFVDVLDVAQCAANAALCLLQGEQNEKDTCVCGLNTAPVEKIIQNKLMGLAERPIFICKKCNTMQQPNPQNGGQTCFLLRLLSHISIFFFATHISEDMNTAK